MPTMEFQCTECKRRIIQICGPKNEFRLCAACLMLPGWFRDPEMRKHLGWDDDDEMNWKTSVVPVACCPQCGHALDRAGSPDGATPGPGDASVCIECAAFLVFNEDMTVRLPTESEIAEVSASFRKTIRNAQDAVRALHRRSRHG